MVSCSRSSRVRRTFFSFFLFPLSPRSFQNSALCPGTCLSPLARCACSMLASVSALREITTDWIMVLGGTRKYKSLSHLLLTWPGWGWCLCPSHAGRSPCGQPASCPASRGASCPTPWTPLLWWSSDQCGLLPRGQSGCGCRSCLLGWTWWSSYKLERGEKLRFLTVSRYTHNYHMSGLTINSLSIFVWVQISTRSPFLMFRRKLAASSRVKWAKSTLFTWTKWETSLKGGRHFYLKPDPS